MSYNLNSGGRGWKTQLGGIINSNLLVNNIDDKNIFVATESFNSSSSSPSKRKTSLLRSISSLTGLTVWQTSIDSAGEIFLYNYNDELVFADGNANIGVLGKADGQMKWIKNLAGEVTAPPSFSGETLIVALTDKIVAFSVQKASVVFQMPIISVVTSLSSSGNKFFWGDIRGNVYGLTFNKSGKKKLWKFQNGAAVSYVIHTPAGILAASYDNFVYMLSPDSGKLLWKKRMTGRITIRPSVVGNFAAVTSIGSSELSVLDLRDGKIINQILLAENNFLLSSPIPIREFFVLTTPGSINFYSNGDAPGKCSVAPPSVLITNVLPDF